MMFPLSNHIFDAGNSIHILLQGHLQFILTLPLLQLQQLCLLNRMRIWCGPSCHLMKLFQHGFLHNQSMNFVIEVVIPWIILVL